MHFLSYAIIILKKFSGVFFKAIKWYHLPGLNGGPPGPQPGGHWRETRVKRPPDYTSRATQETV